MAQVVFRWIMGDVAGLNDLLKDKSNIIQFPNWFFRAIGAPIFLNNPWSGLLILIGMFLQSAWMAVGACIGLVTAIMTALVVGIPRPDIASGGATFHGMLTAMVITASVQKADWYPWIVLVDVVMAACSVMVAAGLGFIFGRFNLPAFNLPFCVTAFVFLSACAYNPSNQHFPVIPPPSNTTEVEAGIQWGQAMQPLLLAGAQIYGSAKLEVGALVLVALIIGSPIVATHAVVGAFLSIFTALALHAPLNEVYAGTWSYNALLTCSSLGGFFWVLTPASSVAAMMAAVFSTVTYGAVAALLKPAGLPVIAFPFVLTATIFLAVSTETKALRRVPMDKLSYPEQHRTMFLNNDAPVNHSQATISPQRNNDNNGSANP